MNGEFTPVPFSEPRFEKKVAAVEKLTEELSAENKKLNFFINDDYLYPKSELKSIMRAYKNKPLDPGGKTAVYEGKNPNTTGFFGSGFGGPGFIQRGKNLIERALPGKQFESKITTPPLPKTPMPSKQLSQAPNIDPQTNLTSTETALLSPTEKVIAGRS